MRADMVKDAEFLTNKINPKLLVDFAGLNYLSLPLWIQMFSCGQKNPMLVKPFVLQQNDKTCIKELYHKQQTICEFNGSDSWVVLSLIEQSIKQKLSQ